MGENPAYRLSVSLRAWPVTVKSGASVVADAPAVAPAPTVDAASANAHASIKPESAARPATPAASAPQRLVLPTLDSTAAQWLNSAADRLDGLPLRLGERALKLRLRPPTVAADQVSLVGMRFGFAPAADQKAGAETEAEAVPAIGWLGISEFLVRQLIERYVPLEQLPELPNELICAVLETVLEPLLAAGERGLGRSLQLQGMVPATVAEREFTPARTLRLALEDAAVTPGAAPLLHSVRLALSEPLLPMVNDAISRLPAAPVPGFPPPNLPIKINFEGGVTQLSLAELRTLEPGDLVMVDEYLWPARPALVINVEGQRRGVAALDDNGRRATIEKFLEFAMPEENPATPNNAGADPQNAAPEQDAGAAPEPEQPAPATANPAAGGAAEPARAAGPNFDNLPLPLVFEVGSMTLPLSELAALRPGYVFDLNKAPDKLVTLNVNGTRVGRGELVQIEDRVAVRVLEITTDRIG